MVVVCRAVEAVMPCPLRRAQFTGKNSQALGASSWAAERAVWLSTWLSNAVPAARGCPPKADFRYNLLGAPVAQ